MNKYTGELTYSMVGIQHLDSVRMRLRFPNDALVIEHPAHTDVHRHPKPSRIVAWCTSRESANAARRLLSGECA